MVYVPILPRYEFADVGQQETFRKRLATALHWYLVLDNRAETTVTQYLGSECGILGTTLSDTEPVQSCLGVKRAGDAQSEDDERQAKRTRRSFSEQNDVPQAKAKRAARKPSGEDGDVSDAQSEDDDRSATHTQHRDGTQDDAAQAQAKRAARQPSIEDVEDDDDIRRRVKARLTEDGTNGFFPDERTTPAAGARASRAARRAERDEKAEDDGPKPCAAAREKLTRPSADLRAKCPLCFGGARPSLEHTEYVALLSAQTLALTH